MQQSQKGRKTFLRKIIASVMGILMGVSLMPLTAAAVPDQTSSIHTINLNNNGLINGIETPNGGEGWEGSRIYFGTMGGKPLLWRVLDNQVGDITDSQVMLLQTDSVIGEMAFDEDGQPNEGQTNLNDWIGSDIRSWLNGSENDQFLNGFDKAEKSLFYPFYEEEEKSQTASDDEIYSIFLLSSEEATKADFGYSLEKNRIMTTVSENDACDWWLRSVPTDDSSGKKIEVIGKDGKRTSKSIPKENTGDQIPQAGIVAAVYLNTANILFITPAVNSKPEKLDNVKSLAGNQEWKLTLKGTDKELGASLAGNTSEFERNGIISLNHTSVSGLAKATQISALITTADGTPVYYGKINEKTDVSNSQIIVPGDMPEGNYKLYVFAESVNKDKHTDYAGALGNAISIVISQKETPKVTTLPVADTITYGQTLADTAFKGGEVKSGTVVVPGRFTWVDSSLRPQVSDSNTTSYGVLFTPLDIGKYLPITIQVTLRVQKVQNAPDKPEANMTVEYSVTRVKQVSLPEGWFWKQEDQERELIADGQIIAGAIYKDTDNYENYTATVIINRKSCTHSGGTASCTGQAICDICKQHYGTIDSKKHSYTEKITKQPTTSEEGIKTFTCSACGHQYTESIAKLASHSHYYNNEKTLRWLGCVQQGEVEHSCACGDSYVVVTPAPGHKLTEVVTTKATTEKAGVKTITCSGCGWQYTEAIPRLSSNSGSNSNSNSGGSGISGRIPYVEGKNSIKGWTDINDLIKKASKGETIQINMGDSFILPKKTLESLKGRDVTLVLDIGNDIKWSIKGTDITADNFKDINLKITKNSNNIPTDLVSDMAGEHNTLQFYLVHEGNFGCSATLQILVDSQKSGYYANLFYYNKDAGLLEYVGSSQMDENGVASLVMTHASDYVIILDTAIYDGSELEIIETPETVPQLPEETEPITEETPVNSRDSSFLTKLAVIIGLVALAICLSLVAYIQIRSKRAGLRKASE